MDISLVIPVFNEENNLRILHQQVTRVLQSLKAVHEVIYVDDGSTDNSYAILREMQLSDSTLKVLGLTKNCGQTAAFVAGLGLATGKYILTLESDLTYDCSDLIRVLRELGEYDAVIGFRYNRGEIDGFVKHVSSKVANYVRNKVLGEHFSDAGCFLRGFRRECFDRFVFSKEFQVFTMSFLQMQGYRIKEIPIKAYPRRFGRSNYGIRNRVIAMLCALMVVRYMKDNAVRYCLRENDAAPD